MQSVGSRLYGPGASDDQVERLAFFNIVDDEPALASEWLPYLAAYAGAQRPMRVPKWLARVLAGSGSDDYDRGPRLFQRHSQAGARLGAALPVVAPGLQGRLGVTSSSASALSLTSPVSVDLEGEVTVGRPAWAQASNPPTRSVAFARPNWRREAAARLDA